MEQLKLKIIYKKENDIIPYTNNTRTHSREQIEQLKSSILEFGMATPIGLHNKTIVYGHARYVALKELGYTEFPTVDLSYMSEAQMKAYIIADNRLALNAGWDEELLKIEIESLQDMNYDIDLLGFDDEELEDLDIEIDENLENINNEEKTNENLEEESRKGNMAKEFLMPPFSILDTMKGEWQERKRFWIATMGINSSKGREAKDLRKEESRVSGQIGTQGYSGGEIASGEGVSVFDPVLCELAYKWFSREGNLILDPFAGGSVRGIMASFCNRKYIGNDLREEQIKENKIQANSLIKDSTNMPVWTVGDSLKIKEIVGDVQADLLFSCPPYADLEVYSDLKEDISNMPYNEFMIVYNNIIKECYDMLKEDSFAVWTIGEVRDKKGNYYNFLGDTITAFKNAGFNYYNEIILVNAIGSLPLRAGKAFRATRKIGKRHQNVLVFVKGDGKKAAQKCGEVKIELDNDQE